MPISLYHKNNSNVLEPAPLIVDPNTFLTANEKNGIKAYAIQRKVTRKQSNNTLKNVVVTVFCTAHPNGIEISNFDVNATVVTADPKPVFTLNSGRYAHVSRVSLDKLDLALNKAKSYL